MSQFLARHGRTILDVALGVYGTIATGRHVRKALQRTAGDLENLDLDLRISDFESFYRCALRMREGRPMYFVDAPGIVEQPSKQAPFFELLLQPFVPFGAPLTIVVFGLATIAMLLHGIRLSRRLLATAPSAPAGSGSWSPYVGLFLLAPTLHLNFLYFQTGIMLVWLLLLGLVLWSRRPLLAGVVWSLAVSIKVIPVVFVVWAVWRRQWRVLAGVVLGLAAANIAVLAYTGFGRGFEQYAGYVHMLRSDPAFAEYNERYQSLHSLVRATVTPHYESAIGSSAQTIDWNGVRNVLGSTSLAEHGALLSWVLVGLVLLVCAAACRGRIDPWRAFAECCLVAIAMLLVSPHTWRHYYWWLWPCVVLAAHQARQRRPWAIVVIAVVALAELLPHRGTIGRLASTWQVFHGPTLGAILVFACLATELVRTRCRTTGERHAAAGTSAAAATPTPR